MQNRRFNMKKQAAIVGVILLTVFLLVGCHRQPGTQQTDDTSTSAQQITYSNLVDSSAQKEIAELLEEHGVTKEQTDTLISWADDFNSRVTSSSLAENFQTMQDAGVNYQGLIIQNKEADDGLIYPEANCRLTSYLLMKNLIQTNGKCTDNDTFLMFDVEAIDTYEPFHLSEEERSRFISLFSWVPVNGADTVEAHSELIQKAWQDREVKIEGEGISLITVYLHSPFDEVRFVGHTGVLLETEEGLLFVEKYGPQLPFQATKFHDRTELKQYLLDRQDLYGDETELAPIVLENDQLL